MAKTNLNYDLSVPVRFLDGLETVIEKSIELGASMDYAPDWRPSDLDDAIFEALRCASSAQQCGMVFLDPALPHGEDTYYITVSLLLLFDPDDLEEDVRKHLPSGFKPSLDGCLLGSLNSYDTPADLGFEIMTWSSTASSESAHSRLKAIQAHETYRWHGPADSLFQAQSPR